jgi:uncharacterized protein YbaP (TraB family)
MTLRGISGSVGRPVGLVVFLVVVLLVSLGGLTGCLYGPAPATAPQAAAAPARPPLWKVTSDDGAGAGVGTGYLLGSIHLARERDHPLPASIDRAFAEADVVVFELDLDQTVVNAFGLLIAGYYQDDRTLQSALSEETWALLEENQDALPMPLSFLAKAKPWLLALMLSIGDLEASGFSAEVGIDQMLFRRAKDADKPRVALETVVDQVAFFDGLTAREQELFLLQTLTEREETAAQADEIAALWERGDTEGLAEVFEEGDEEFPAVREKLLIERNRRWVPRIEELLRQHGTVLVVVGTAHLVGEDSVVDLLRDAGYEVTQE